MSLFPTLKSVDLLTVEAFQSYLDTLLWSSSDNDGNSYGDYIEPSDLDESEIETQWYQCYGFIKANSEAIFHLVEEGHTLERIMHDFCLTRNRHGAGFWDGDYPEPYATQLTESAHRYAEVSLHTGDDGGVYIFCG